MRFLLDKHVVLWVLGRPHRLPEPTRAHIADDPNRLVFNAATICEIAVKRAFDRPDFRAVPVLVRQDLLDLG